MKIKLAKLVDPGFNSAIISLQKRQMPLKVAYRLKNIVLKMSEELDKYNSLRMEALQRYGKKDAKGILVTIDGVIQFEDKNLEKFLKEVDELLSIEIEVQTISISDLDPEAFFSVEDLNNLDGFIVE